MNKEDQEAEELDLDPCHVVQFTTAMNPMKWAWFNTELHRCLSTLEKLVIATSPTMLLQPPELELLLMRGVEVDHVDETIPQRKTIVAVVVVVAAVEAVAGAVFVMLLPVFWLLVPLLLE